MEQMFGAIDLGGTKIEACLFDAELQVLHKRRIPTPQVSYAAMLDGVIEQCRWLTATAGNPHLQIGIGVPGLVDHKTGLSWTSNLPATGQPLQADIIARLGRTVAMENDCKCFALSEAHGGAGQGMPVVFGLILGTGVGGGLCQGGRLMLHHSGLAGEVGHFGLPVHLVEEYRLPVLACGCGRRGCFETLVSGQGLVRLCQHMTGRPLEAQAIVAGMAAGDAALARVFDCWLTLLAELVHTIHLVVDPDCVVLGGGLSLIEELPTRLSQQFARQQLPATLAPSIRRARFGDSSGVRGAAILAQQLAQGAAS